LLVLNVLREAVTKQSLKAFLCKKSLGGQAWKERHKTRAAMMQDVLAWYEHNQQQALPLLKQQPCQKKPALQCVKTEVEYVEEKIIVTDGSSSTSSSSHSSIRVRELGSSSSIGEGGVGKSCSSSIEQHEDQAALCCATIDLTEEDDNNEVKGHAVANDMQASVIAAACGGDDLRGSADSSRNNRSGNRRTTLDTLAGWETGSPPLKPQHGALGQEHAAVYSSKESLLQQSALGKQLGGSGGSIRSAQDAYRGKVLQGQVKAERRRR
jgi:hypothetical protein